MVLEGDVGNLGAHTVRMLYDFTAVYRMQLHFIKLLICELARLLKYFQRHLALAYIMQDSTHSQRRQRFISISQLFAEYYGIDAYVYRVKVCIIVNISYTGQLEHYCLIIDNPAHDVIDSILNH